MKGEKKKSFSLRHPYLTGIPTLGIAPAIAKNKAYSRTERRMLRGSHKLRTAKSKADEVAHRRMIEEMQADAPVAAAGQHAVGLIGAAGLLAGSRK